MDNRPSRHRLVRIRSSRCEPPGQRRLPIREIGGALVRIGLLTEGGYPYVSGEARLWCDRLVRGLGQHEFDIYALCRSERQEDEGWIQLPSQVSRVRTAPLWTADDDVTPSGHPAIMQLDRPPIDSAWLETELQELERLIEGGETLELVGRLAAIARAPRRLGVAELGATVTATSLSKPA